MAIFQILAANITRADVIEAWIFYLILIVVFSSVVIYRRFNYASAAVCAVTIIILSLTHHLIFADTSGPCPHYGDYGYFIVIAITSIIYTIAFYGRNPKRKMLSMSFAFFAVFSLFLMEEKVMLNTYRVIFEGKELFKSI